MMHFPSPTVNSEHSYLFQCLKFSLPPEIFALRRRQPNHCSAITTAPTKLDTNFLSFICLTCSVV